MYKSLQIKQNNNTFCFEPHLIDDLTKMKNKITNNSEWDIAKKMSNDYELIYQPNKKMRQHSVAKYHPISRSFFKLWEIIYDFNLLHSKKNLTLLGLAEGPGGFIECMLKFRKNKNDTIWGITLKSNNNKDIPDWKKSFSFLKNHNINISYGRDHTGNLYNIDNILYLKKQIGKPLDFITGDGGFDFSNNFNNQEQLGYRIIFAQIIASLTLQKIGGDFVLKIFDINTENTIRMIYLLYAHYHEVHITKPYTSRPANSEKYIICKGYKGIQKNMEIFLQNQLRNWNSSFISFITIPSWFLNQIKKYNEMFIKHQIENIKKTLVIIENKQIHNNSIQLKNAIKWCKDYKIEII